MVMNSWIVGHPGGIHIRDRPKTSVLAFHAANWRRICHCYLAASSFPNSVGEDLLLTPGEHGAM
jgi:hypothetical protein